MYWYRDSPKTASHIQRRGGIFNCTICDKWHYRDSKIGQKHWEKMQSIDKQTKKDVKVKTYLSYGAGVNSTALMLLLLDEGIDFEAVYVDPGTEKPETYDYLEYLQGQDYKFTWIKPIVGSENNLYDYLLKYKILPSVFVRCCTAKFKTEPFYNYIETPATVYIGYDFGERGYRHLSDKEGTEYKFPLIKRRITRDGCKKIIREHDLEVPIKSGCWLCPFQNKESWINLRNKWPTLFRMAMSLEDANPRGFTIMKDGPLSRFWQDNKLLDYLEATP